MKEKPETPVAIKEVPIPAPGPKDVLIKVICAPLMPLDKLLSFAGVFQPPYVLGAQASGEVEKIGAEVPKEYLHKKVQFGCSLLKFNDGTFKGTWSQYVCKPYDDVYVYDQSISHEAACAMYGNPLTGMGVYRKIMEYKPKCVIMYPGAATIAKVITNLLMKAKVKVISIVRSDEIVKVLKDLGYEFVLNIKDPKFDENIKNLITTHQPTVLCDGVTDELSTKIFLQMPHKSTQLIYGALSGNMTVNIPIFPMLMMDKSVTGYYWSAEDFYKPRKEIVKELDEVNEDLKKGGKIYGSPLIKKYKMEQFMEAITEQSSYASKGQGVIYFH